MVSTMYYATAFLYFAPMIQYSERQTNSRFTYILTYSRIHPLYIAKIKSLKRNKKLITRVLKVHGIFKAGKRMEFSETVIRNEKK